MALRGFRLRLREEGCNLPEKLFFVTIITFIAPGWGRSAGCLCRRGTSQRPAAFISFVLTNQPASHSILNRHRLMPEESRGHIFKIKSKRPARFLYIFSFT
jgi:hypothetical protein